MKDFSTWSGLSNADVKTVIGMVKPLFNQEKFNNENYYFPSPVLIDRQEIQNAYLLPIYDEYLWATKTGAPY